MPIGCARVSKGDGSQLLDLQREALLDADVAEADHRRHSRRDPGGGLR